MFNPIHVTRSILLLWMSVGLAITLACGTDSKGNEAPDSPDDGSQAAGAQLTNSDFGTAAAEAGLEAVSFDTESRSKDGIKVSVDGSKVVEVGSTGLFFIGISNVTNELEDTAPYGLIQTEGQILLGGPIELVRNSNPDIEGTISLPIDGAGSGAVLTIKCLAVGTGTVSFQSTGEPMGHTPSPIVSYTIVVDNTLQCVADDDNPLTFADFSDLTAGQLASSPDSIDWVAFPQAGVTLRLNQIDPVELQVGESIDIYSDFDARESGREGVDQQNGEQLVDARIEFTFGGPVSIDSPHDRIAEPGILTLGFPPDDYSVVFWGFRSGTLTCLGTGEGVYTANLIAERATGEDVRQNVSGLVDCVDEWTEFVGEDAEPTEPSLSEVEVLADEPTVFMGAYMFDGMPYHSLQFSVSPADESCTYEHLHSMGTVYPFFAWTTRATEPVLQFTEDLPLADPDPDGCGFGQHVSTNAPGILVPESEVRSYCDRSQLRTMTLIDDIQKIAVPKFLKQWCDGG